VNNEICGVDWFQVFGRGFSGSLVEQWITEADVYFTSYSDMVWLYSLDLTNSELVERLLAKKLVNTEVCQSVYA
jgi:hypothetical protein